MVFSMCRLVIAAMENGNEQVIADVKRICKYSEELPKTAQQLTNAIFHTVFMGMSKQSSKETRQRASGLSQAIGSYHVDLDIDEVYEAQRQLIVKKMNFEPKFRTQGGTSTENLALQNIQARTRMVTAYEFAQLLPLSRGRPGGGGLLVLGSANVGEALRGYFTKYDCSSADVRKPLISVMVVSMLTLRCK
jgi:NAD+ synthase (glutamine-hydrolysing)